MADMEKAPERKRRDWIIILVILLIGFICVILAGGWAIRFSPTWKMDTDMGSNIDPNSVFLTSRPSGFLEPLDPSILTQPVWINVFLTPGASFPTNIPVTSLPTSTPLATNTTLPTAIISPTNTGILPSPTNTSIYFPPPTNTNTPKPPSTNTPVTPSLSADLSITKTDGVTVYTPGNPLTYTIVVSNASGPDAVTGATVIDTFPASLTNITWICTPTGSASCTANGTGNINDTVNLPVGSSVTYTVNVDVLGSAIGNLTNTVTVTPPMGVNDPTPANNFATDTDTLFVPPPTADLQITKTDNSTHYLPNATKIYSIVVSNNGPSNVIGATVTDDLTNTNIASANWTCAGTGGGTCSASGSNDINDLVNLPSGASVTYTVSVTVSNSPSGDLVNTATVTPPVGITDNLPGNNSDTDTDFLITVDPVPPNVGTKDNLYYTLPAGSTLTLGINLTADSDADWDLVFYEYTIFPVFDGVLLDWIRIDISDGSNWYTVFYWGDNISDDNTNVAHGLLTIPVTPPDPEEVDQRYIASGDLYNTTGVAIDIDSIVPPGTYTYIRFYAPPGDTDGQAEIDAIEILP